MLQEVTATNCMFTLHFITQTAAVFCIFSLDFKFNLLNKKWNSIEKTLTEYSIEKPTLCPATKCVAFAFMIPAAEKNQNLPHVAETRRVYKVQNDTEKPLAY